MKPSRFTEQQIIGILRDQEAGRRQPTCAASSGSRARRYKMTLRRQTAEHPFGIIKSLDGCAQFLMRRRHKVATEMALNVLAYNMKRVRSNAKPAVLVTFDDGYADNCEYAFPILEE